MYIHLLFQIFFLSNNVIQLMDINYGTDYFLEN